MDTIKNEIRRIRHIFIKSTFIEKYIRSNDNLLRKKKIATYYLMFFMMLVLAIIHLITSNSQMLIIVGILGIGALISAILIHKTAVNTNIIDWFWTVVICVIFSIAVLKGIDSGYIILWLLILPSGLMALNRKVSIYPSIYIFLFTLIICFTPLKNNIGNYYPDTFFYKFSILAFSSFLISLCLWLKITLAERILLVRTYTDELTGLGNRIFFNEICDYIERKGKKAEYIFVSFNVNGLKKINDTKGYVIGDEVLKAVSNIITKASDKTISVCRIDGDEFVAIIKGNKMSIPSYEENLAKLQKEYKSANIDSISFSYGLVACIDHLDKNINEIYKIADDKMREEKVKYCIHNGINRRVKQRRNAERRKTNLISSSKGEKNEKN